LQDTQSKFNLFLATRASQTAKISAATPEQNALLFQQFLQWQQETAAAKSAAKDAAPARKRQDQ
jgi:hypothetical protein